jgi:hypothetical protein
MMMQIANVFAKMERQKRNCFEPFSRFPRYFNQGTRHPLGHLMDQSRFTVELCAFNHPNVLRAIEAKTGIDPEPYLTLLEALTEAHDLVWRPDKGQTFRDAFKAVLPQFSFSPRETNILKALSLC